MENCVFFLLSLTLIGVNSLPQYNPNQHITSTLNSAQTVGTFGQADSEASAHGPGSTVEISGIVTGDSSNFVGAASSPSSGPSSNLSAQGNCSDFSTSNASGSEGANAVATGGCVTNMDNTGNHQLVPSAKVEIGMGTQVTGQGGGQANQSNLNNTESQSQSVQYASQEAQIAQASSQNESEGIADAYHYVNGPQATVQFSGIMANAATQADNAVSSGTSETIMNHNLGNTVIETILPFAKE